MSITNIQVTENRFAGANRLLHIYKRVVSFATGVPNNETGKVPSTARGRALYTVDYFLHGRPALLNHDSTTVTLRNSFAS